jgi:hypothetical protein
MNERTIYEYSNVIDRRTSRNIIEATMDRPDHPMNTSFRIKAVSMRFHSRVRDAAIAQRKR